MPYNPVPASFQAYVLSKNDIFRFAGEITRYIVKSTQDALNVSQSDVNGEPEKVIVLTVTDAFTDFVFVVDRYTPVNCHGQIGPNGL